MLCRIGSYSLNLSGYGVPFLKGLRTTSRPDRLLDSLSRRADAKFPYSLFSFLPCTGRLRRIAPTAGESLGHILGVPDPLTKEKTTTNQMTRNAPYWHSLRFPRSRVSALRFHRLRLTRAITPTLKPVPLVLYAQVCRPPILMLFIAVPPLPLV